MSWAVGDDREHDRFRGYGVPAYCDAWAAGCRTEIDRGLTWLCDHVDYDHDGDLEVGGCGPLDDLERPTIFVCGRHTCADVDEAHLPPEHPKWANHLLTDESWATWREENPNRVAILTETVSTERETEPTKEQV